MTLQFWNIYKTQLSRLRDLVASKNIGKQYRHNSEKIKKIRILFVNAKVRTVC